MIEASKLRQTAPGIIKSLDISTGDKVSPDILNKVLCTGEPTIIINDKSAGSIRRAFKDNPFINLVGKLIDIAKKRGGSLQGDVKVYSSDGAHSIEIKNINLDIKNESDIPKLPLAQGDAINKKLGRKDSNKNNYLKTINDGELVCFGDRGGKRCFLIADFEETLKDTPFTNLSPEIAKRMIAQNKDKFEECAQYYGVKSETLVALDGATEMVKFVLGNFTSDHGVRLGEMFSIDLEGNTAKKLSESKGKAMCSEIALLAKHLLDKMGIESIYIDGGIGLSDGSFDGHSFLFLPKENMVFDIATGAINNGEFYLYSHKNKLTAELFSKKGPLCYRLGQEKDRSKVVLFTT